jgi:hypothetical protein
MTVAGQDQTVWAAGGGRKVILSFLFLILLPFYLSLGPMLFQRISRGFVGDSVSLAVFGLLFSVVMALLLARLVQSVRSRVELGPTSVKLALPAYGKGPVPLFRFNDREISYADIEGVDRRCEIYGGSFAPVRLTSTRLTLKGGERLVLGYSDAYDSATVFPMAEIGDAIAARAGKSVIDHGVVHRSVQRRLKGEQTAEEEKVPLTAADVAAINVRHRRNVVATVAGLVLLVAGGIVIDLMTAPRTSFATLATPEARPPARK